MKKILIALLTVLISTTSVMAEDVSPATEENNTETVTKSDTVLSDETATDTDNVVHDNEAVNTLTEIKNNDETINSTENTAEENTENANENSNDVPQVELGNFKTETIYNDDHTVATVVVTYDGECEELTLANQDAIMELVQKGVYAVNYDLGDWVNSIAFDVHSNGLVSLDINIWDESYEDPIGTKRVETVISEIAAKETVVEKVVEKVVEVPVETVVYAGESAVSTAVSYSLEAYTWNIPADFDLNTTDTIDISIGNLNLAEYQILNVTVNSANNFNMVSDNAQQISYGLYEDGNSSPLTNGSNVLKYQPDVTNKSSNSLRIDNISIPGGTIAGEFRDVLTFTSSIDNDPNYYSITYNLNGGTLTGSYPKMYSSSKGLGSLPAPTKDGYNFLGWHDGTNYVTGIPAGSTGAVSLTAEWKSQLPNKGDIVTMSDLGLTDVDANADSTTDIFRVLSVEGSNVKLLAMDSYKYTRFNVNNIDTYAGQAGGTIVDNTYAGSILDTEMTNYYNALPENVKSAIVPQNINQSKYSWSNSPSGSDNFSSWSKIQFTESDVSGTNYYLNRTTEKNAGNRKVYALDVDDIISYLGSTSTPQDVNELFFNQRSNISRDVWLRSASADSSDSAFYVRGDFGRVDYNVGTIFQYEVRPAFVLNLG